MADFSLLPNYGFHDSEFQRFSWLLLQFLKHKRWLCWDGILRWRAVFNYLFPHVFEGHRNSQTTDNCHYFQHLKLWSKCLSGSWYNVWTDCIPIRDHLKFIFRLNLSGICVFTCVCCVYQVGPLWSRRKHVCTPHRYFSFYYTRIRQTDRSVL